MDKNLFAVNPPMGWNSWDCYGASVTEEDLIRNADYMAEHLKPYGWEYVVCDIQWSEPTADSTAYHAFAELCMDEYGRLMPSPNRFPSAADGKGFKPIADYIHSKGLKFGIHIMRGIPRQAVVKNVPIKGTDVHARDIAHTASICAWNSDMYGLNPVAVGAQAYYDSLFELYASWGVDFVKVDDICVVYRRINQDYDYSGREEIEMIAAAIQHCGRDIVLSLSPGPAMVEQGATTRANTPICGALPTISGTAGKILLKCSDALPQLESLRIERLLPGLRYASGRPYLHSRLRARRFRAQHASDPP